MKTRNSDRGPPPHSAPPPLAIATHGPLHGEIPGKNPFLAGRFFPVFRETGVSTTPLRGVPPAIAMTAPAPGRGRGRSAKGTGGVGGRRGALHGGGDEGQIGSVLLASMHYFWIFTPRPAGIPGQGFFRKTLAVTGYGRIPAVAGYRILSVLFVVVWPVGGIAPVPGGEIPRIPGCRGRDEGAPGPGEPI